MAECTAPVLTSKMQAIVALYHSTAPLPSPSPELGGQDYQELGPEPGGSAAMQRSAACRRHSLPPSLPLPSTTLPGCSAHSSWPVCCCWWAQQLPWLSPCGMARPSRLLWASTRKCCCSTAAAGHPRAEAEPWIGQGSGGGQRRRARRWRQRAQRRSCRQALPALPTRLCTHTGGTPSALTFQKMRCVAPRR